MYTLHIANIDTVFCMAASDGTASGGGVTNVDINKCYCYNRRGRRQLRERLRRALELATMFALAPAAGVTEEVSLAGGDDA